MKNTNAQNVERASYKSKKYLRLHMAADHPTEWEDVKHIHAPTQVLNRYIRAQMHSGHIKKNHSVALGSEP